MSQNLPPVSVQLYTLREASEADFDQVLAQLAQIGFKGVEPFHLFGKTPAAFAAQVEQLGMRISSTHLPWANRTDDLNQIIEVLQAFGLRRAAGGFMPDDFKDMDALQRTVETTARLVDALGVHGITLCLHNHWWEYDLIDGQPGYYYLQDAVPGVEFEIDTYWAANFGARDPAAEVARVRDRAPLLHIKDGPLQRDAANVAVGSGRMNIPALFAAADADTLEWAIVELDRCDTDMMQAVAASYEFLTTHNLVQGNV